MMTKSKHADEATLRYYFDEAPLYFGSGKGGVNRFLLTFMGQLNDGARVLDLGCGSGRDSEEMLLRGFDVVSWDASPEISRKAEKRIKRAVCVKRFDELNVKAEFDAIWASASLLHVPIRSLPEILSRVHAALKPQGVHFASYKSGGVEGRDSVGRYFNFLSKEQMLTAYALSGNWELQKVQEYEGGGFDHGRQGPWVALLASKQ